MIQIMKKYLLSVCLMAGFLGAVVNIQAKTTRSIGTGNWDVAGTWDNGVPIAGDSAIIEGGFVVTCTTAAAATTVLIQGSGSGNTGLTINSGVTLTVSYNFWAVPIGASQTINIINNGTISVGSNGLWFRNPPSGFASFVINLTGSGRINSTGIVNLLSGATGTTTNYNIESRINSSSKLYLAIAYGGQMYVNLKDTIQAASNITLQSVYGASVAANCVLNMDNSNAVLYIPSSVSWSILSNGGMVTNSSTGGTIYAATPNSLSTYANITYNNVTIGGTGTLPGSLTFLGSLNIQSGTTTLGTNSLNIGGNLVLGGSLSTSAGSNVTLNGTSAQTISGSTASTFDILTINNAAGVSNNHTNLQIRNRLDITNGNYDADGTGAGVTTLLSTSSQTANLGQVLGSISGNITAQRTIPGVNTTDWLYLTSPIQGTTLANFSNCTTGNDKAFYSYGYTGSCQSSAGGYVSSYTYDPSTETTNNGALDGWVAATNSTNAVTPQQGRIFYGGNTAGTYARSSYFLSLTGVPYTGTVVVNAANGARTGTINHSDADGGWFLFGNPYASAVDWVEVLINSGTSRVDVGRCYIYGVNDGGWIELGAISNILPSFQAVMAHSNGASPTVEFEEDDKSTSNAAIVKSNTAAQEMKIKITSPIVPNFSFAIVRFDATGTDAFDSGKDSWQYENIAPFPNVGIVSSDDIKLQVQTTGLTGYKAIPLRTTCHASGNFTLEFSNIAAANACVILEDKLTGNFTTLTDAQNTYSFSMDDTTNAPRFVLHLYEATQSLGTAPGTCHGTNDGSAEIKLHPGSFELTWYNANDSLLHTSQNVSDSASLDQLAPGNYYIEVWRNDAACMPTKEHFTIFAPGEMQPDFTLKGSAFELRTEAPISFRNTSAGPISAYHWDFGDNTTSTLPEPVHTYAKGGSYTVTLTTGNGNPDCDVNTTKALTITDKYLSVNEYGIEGLRVYAHGGQLHTENGLGEGRYRFVNISGQTVGEGVLPSGTQTLSIPDAAGKVFIFATEIDGNSGTYRIIH
jgi:hypothetical protein